MFGTSITSRVIGSAFATAAFMSSAPLAQDRPDVMQAFFTGNQLYPACAEDRNICALYASATIDTMKIMGAKCYAPGATRTQVGDVLFEYLQKQTGIRHHAAASMAVSAMYDAGLCQRR